MAKVTCKQSLQNSKIKAQKSLIKLNAIIEKLGKEENPNWAHVGDLNSIVKGLDNMLEGWVI